MAQSYIIEVDTDNDVLKLEQFANENGWRLKPSIISTYIPATKDTGLHQRFSELKEKGIDVSVFGDPSAWQRETRADVPPPGRSH